LNPIYTNTYIFVKNFREKIVKFDLTSYLSPN